MPVSPPVPKTYFPRQAEVEREWVVIDASGVPLGRLASVVAARLLGKHKPNWVPHLPCGDRVIVVNASKVSLDEGKAARTFYYRHSGYPGGLKQVPYLELLRNRPERLVRKAVWGMLPKNRLGRRLLKDLKVYASAEHPHQAQNPRAVEI